MDLLMTCGLVGILVLVLAIVGAAAWSSRGDRRNFTGGGHVPLMQRIDIDPRVPHEADPWWRRPPPPKRRIDG